MWAHVLSTVFEISSIKNFILKPCQICFNKSASILLLWQKNVTFYHFLSIFLLLLNTDRIRWKWLKGDQQSPMSPFISKWLEAQILFKWQKDCYTFYITILLSNFSFATLLFVVWYNNFDSFISQSEQDKNICMSWVY